MKNIVIITMLLLLGGANMTNADNAGKGVGTREKATFAGGCFWCMQPPFDRQKGVVSTLVGYTGGHKRNPTYEEVSSGSTGHAEAMEVVYDPAQVTYAELLDLFWRNVDPTTFDGQFADRGSQYRTAVFYHDEGQRKLAMASKEKMARSKKFGDRPIVTQIVPASTFYPAEEYHQKYYEKNGVRYKMYRHNSGRDQFLDKTWGKDGKE
jgi:methionine-S-sulfoxide reductase